MGRRFVCFSTFYSRVERPDECLTTLKQLINPLNVNSLEICVLPLHGSHFCDFTLLANLEHFTVRGIYWNQFAIRSEKLISFSFEHMRYLGNRYFETGFMNVVCKSNKLEYLSLDTLPFGYRGLISSRLKSVSINGHHCLDYHSGYLNKIYHLLEMHQESFDQMCEFFNTLKRDETKFCNVHSLYLQVLHESTDMARLTNFKTIFPVLGRIFYGFDDFSDTGALKYSYFDHDIRDVIYRFAARNVFDGVGPKVKIRNRYKAFVRNYNRYHSLSYYELFGSRFETKIRHLNMHGRFLQRIKVEKM